MEKIHEQLTHLMKELSDTLTNTVTTATKRAENSQKIIEEQKALLEQSVATLDFIGDFADQMADTLNDIAAAAYSTADAFDQYLDDITPDEPLPDAID